MHPSALTQVQAHNCGTGVGIRVTRTQWGELKHTQYGLEEGGSYRVYITAENKQGRSGRSPRASILAATVPNAADKPTVTDVTSTSISLEWASPHSRHEIAHGTSIDEPSDRLYFVFKP